MDSKRLVQADKAYIWHPFTAHNEWDNEDVICIIEGEGPFLIDANGKKYLDGVSSLWLNLLGHRNPTIDQAIRDQLNRITHSTMLGLTHDKAIELALKLVEIAPKGLTRVFYSDDGATACEIAVKAAFVTANRSGKDAKLLASFDGAYHGDTLGAVSAGGIAQFHEIFGPLLFKTLRLPYPHCYECPWNCSKQTCSKMCFDEIEKLIAKQADEIFALIIEPLIQGASGMRTAPEGFLAHLRKVCDKTDILFICDEVATGFYRTGALFACNAEGVLPDLLCLAKSITGGYLPLAVTLVTNKVFDAFRGSHDQAFFHGHSYTGNPLACAASLATLHVLEQEKIGERLPDLIQALKDGLNQFQDHPNVGDIRQLGLMAAVELVADRATKTPFDPTLRIGRKICLASRNYGVILRPLGDTLVFMPPLICTPDQILQITQAARRALADVLGECR